MATVDVRLTHLRAAFAAAPGTHAVAIRSGALLADDRPCWMLSPQDGPALLRELTRVAGRSLERQVEQVAGNLLTAVLKKDLDQATLHPGEGRGPGAPNVDEWTPSSGAPILGPGLRRGGARVVRLANDPLPANSHLDGPPLWRRAEPDNDPSLAQSLAADIADWIAACAG